MASKKRIFLSDLLDWNRDRAAKCRSKIRWIRGEVKAGRMNAGVGRERIRQAEFERALHSKLFPHHFRRLAAAPM